MTIKQPSKAQMDTELTEWLGYSPQGVLIPDVMRDIAFRTMRAAKKADETVKEIDTRLAMLQKEKRAPRPATADEQIDALANRVRRLAEARKNDAIAIFALQRGITMMIESFGARLPPETIEQMKKLVEDSKPCDE